MEKKQPQIFRLRQKTVDRDEAIIAAVKAIRKGFLIIMPTDTVYGVAVDARIPGAEEKIYLAKSRDRGKPIPILAADINQVEEYGVEFSRVERKLAEKFWPGPLTLVLNVGRLTEGFRVPDNEVALELLRAAGGSLRVTSANVSGEKPALTAGEAIASLGEYVAVVLDAGKVRGGVPSTVVKVENEKIVILREGALGQADLLSVL